MERLRSVLASGHSFLHERLDVRAFIDELRARHLDEHRQIDARHDAVVLIRHDKTAGGVIRTAAEEVIEEEHAAHERINFDRLKAAKTPPMRQTLLQPVAAELTKEDGALLLENLSLLEQFGFACEDFGDGAVLVREVPADIDAGDTVSTLEEFAENLRSGKSLEEKREKVPAALATQVSRELTVPTIGIGAGNGCDGQVLVVHDMLGMNKGFKPKFLRHYAQLHDTITDAVGQYVGDVKTGDFPNDNESY